jgi:hypothetical protein
MTREHEHTFGLKIANDKLNAKTLYCIRKATGLSLSDIKQKISDNDYLMLIVAGDTEGIQNINKLRNELTNFNVAIRLYQDDKEKSSEYFDNIEQTWIDIKKESEEHF